MQEVIKIFKQIQDTSSTNDKKAIIAANKDNELFKKCLRFLFDSNIKTGIAKKKYESLTVGESDWVHSDIDKEFCELLDYIKEHNTGRDEDVIQVQAWCYEMSDEVKNMRNEDGELTYGESHIMCNLFTIEAIEKISKEPLIYHSAFKKNSYIDEDGKEIIPDEPNSYKFEAFIFDSFELFDDIAILRGKREDDFAPVKNKDGVDSPKTAKELYEKYWERQK